MSLTAPPKTTVSGWRRHPLLWVYWLTVRNAVGRFFEQPRKAWGVLLASAALIVAWSSELTLRAFNLLSDYRGLTVVLLALYAALSSNARRGVVEKAHAESWLIAAPIGSSQVHWSITLGGIVPLAARCLVVGAVLVLVGLGSREPAARVLDLTSVLVAAMLAGVLGGWWLPRLLGSRETNEARYLRPPTVVGTPAPSLEALAAWPMAQTRSWWRPQNARLILMAALMAVQAGSSAMTGLFVVATWLVAAYLSGLLAALLRTGREAAQWLRTTPISFARFAWPLARRVFLHQAIGAVAACLGMVALGAPLGSALHTGTLWLTLVLLVASLSLADSYRCRAPGLKLVLSLSALAGVESRQHGWSIPLALMLAAWHWRGRTA
jgi:hypothetical protein